MSGTTITQQLTSERMSEFGAAAPIGRLVRPDEVANTIAFLASEGSGFTTGHYLPVNGGLAIDRRAVPRVCRASVAGCP